MVGKEWNFQIVLNLPLTSVPTFTDSNAKTLALKHLEVPDVATSSGPLEGTCLAHQGTDELLVEQDSIPDVENTSVYDSS